MKVDESLDYHGWSLLVGDDLCVFENTDGLQFFSDIMRACYGEVTYCQERDGLAFSSSFSSSLDITWRGKELIIHQSPPYALLDLLDINEDD